VTPLRAGSETFPAMLAAIEAARQRVHLEMYILRADRIGTRFKEALIERARAGLEVRLLYDAIGSFGLPGSYVEELSAAGVQIAEFHPVAPWRPRWGLNTRDHQKILVVDDRVGFTGGINIGDEYVAREEGGGGWHDMHVMIEGPAVHDLARIFRKTWVRAGAEPFPEPALPKPLALPPGELSEVLVASNVDLRNRWRLRQTYLHPIRRAERSICLMSAYFIPDRGLRRALRNATARGVSVRVIVPATSDVKAVYYASRHLYTRLLRSGIRIFEWPEHMMHAKCGVIDAVWSTIGSYNIDRRSFAHNLEVGVIMIDRRLGKDLEAQFERDLLGCREVRFDEWERRSTWQKFLELLFFQIRYWL
jgi:cardiolipin synthase